MAADTTPQRIVIWCPICREAKYKSNRTYVQGDRPEPGDFVALVPDQEPPMDGKPIMCAACGAMCKPILETVFDKLADSTDEPVVVEKPTAKVIPLPTRTAPVDNSVEELFRTEPDEQIVNITNRGEKLLVMTTRRILLV